MVSRHFSNYSQQGNILISLDFFLLFLAIDVQQPAFVRDADAACSVGRIAGADESDPVGHQ